MCDSNDNYLYRLVINPTYASTVTYTDVTDYSISYGLGATANTVSAMGHILSVGSGATNSSQNYKLASAIRLGMALDGTLDEIAVIVKPLTNMATIHRGINWREVS